jgi:hypothetical protein
MSESVASLWASGIGAVAALAGVWLTLYFTNRHRVQADNERIASEGRALQRTTIFEIHELTWDLIRRAAKSETAMRRLEQNVREFGEAMDASLKKADELLRSATAELKRADEPDTPEQMAEIDKLAEDIVAEVMARQDPSLLSDVFERRMQEWKERAVDASKTAPPSHTEPVPNLALAEKAFLKARAEVKGDYLDGLSDTVDRMRQLSARLLDDGLRATTLKMCDLGFEMVVNPVGSEGFSLHAQVFRNEFQAFERELRTYLDGEVNRSSR